MAACGEQAIATINKEIPDLILLDILMIGMDGYEVCAKLKSDKRTAGIPVMFISALDETVDKVKAFSCGAIDYIDKPFKAEEVLAKVNTHLTMSRLKIQLEEKTPNFNRLWTK